MSADNRRRYPRSETDHPATLLYHGTTLSDCHIRNFSRGGLYLENAGCDFPTLVTTTVPKPGGPNIKHALIQIPRIQGDGEPFTLAVSITFVSETGIGVALLQQNPSLYQYFLSLDQNSAAGDAILLSGANKPDPSLGELERIFAQIIQASLRFLSRTLPAFFVASERQLLNEAETAPVDSRKTEIFYAQSALKAQEAVIIDAQLKQLKQRFQLFREQRSASIGSTHSKELNLVDKDDFEEWVVIVGLGRAVEADSPGLLHRVEMGLTRLVRRAVSSDNNPLAPAALLWALSSSLERLNIELPVRSIIYPIFKEAVLSQLAELYQQLDEIFAHYAIDTNVVEFRSKSGTMKRGDAAVRLTHPRHDRSLLETISSIVGPGRRAQEQDREPGGEANHPSREQILAALNHLSRAPQVSLSERVERSLTRSMHSGSPVRLDRQCHATIAATEQLLFALTQEEHLSDALKALLRGLEVPVVREALSDPALLENASHPARRLLESIDQLMPYSSADDDEAPLLRIIEQLSEASPERNQDQLIEATRKIEALLSCKRAAFESNLSLVLESSRQQEKQAAARQEIEQQLSARFDNRSVATLVERLLQLGWPGLLIQTRLAGEASERHTKAYLGALDFLLKHFAPEHEAVPLPGNKLNVLTTILRRGFSAYPVHAVKAQQLIEEIESILREAGEGWRDAVRNRVLIDQRYIRDCLDRQAPLNSGGEGAAPADDTWGELLRQLKPGDWIVQQREHSQVRLINLAWSNSSRTHFVFVDGSGNKALESDAAILAELFASGRCSLLESRELPIVERTVERMLKNTFARVAKESRIDELTGLLNRKAFSRKIDEQLNRSIADGSQHALLLLDLDQFSMVNDVCGYEGGDQLLKSVTRIITTYQRGGTIIARTGDDEFAILLENTTVERGYQIAETQRTALQNFKFSWEQQSVPVSVSIGIVAVDNTASNASGLLKAAATACELAKQSGRNCCRVFQLSDKELQRQNRLIRSVPVIEEALEKNRISLHGQLIQPLFLGEGSEHYEVLLRLLDEKGRPSNPADFIRAAERYDRMRSVDRWIIDTFFTWV
ncbi:MAG: DUF1631 family protein [Gammaproteobacteria bacterium]|nr:DUF1631 family protein [Gammaproteobacteria bacterium]